MDNGSLSKSLMALNIGHTRRPTWKGHGLKLLTMVGSTRPSKPASKKQLGWSICAHVTFRFCLGQQQHLQRPPQVPVCSTSLQTSLYAKCTLQMGLSRLALGLRLGTAERQRCCLLKLVVEVCRGVLLAQPSPCRGGTGGSMCCSHARSRCSSPGRDTGLGSIPFIPELTHSSTSPIATLPVQPIIGYIAPWSRRTAVARSPSITGIWTSMKMSWKDSLAASRTASAPLVASAMVAPGSMFSRLRRSKDRLILTSSTTSTGPGVTAIELSGGSSEMGGRQCSTDPERAAAG
mmetsp:Transcript_33752/g.79029  ORF Transcript_33752/g.79029 Transcript_33752/m.79029 type:complete len:291 (+) Transcript_33752:170-1042(+)